MLGKLLKFELKATGRIMLPLFAALMAASAMLGLNIRYLSRQDNLWILSSIIVLVFALVVMAVAVVSVLLTLQRFYKNLLGQEGYLMFSLPVNTWQQLAGKLLTSLIWIVTALAVGILSGMLLVWVMGVWPGFSREVSRIWSALLHEQSTGKTVMQLILLAIILILGILERIAKVYAAMALGHQWSAHRILGSIFSYVGFNVVEVTLAGILPLNKIMTAVTAQEKTGLFASILPPTGLVLGVVGCMLILYSGITWRLLDRRLNLQ